LGLFYPLKVGHTDDLSRNIGPNQLTTGRLQINFKRNPPSASSSTTPPIETPMSLTARLIKTAIKWTPERLITLVANIALKGIARVSAFNVDLGQRTLHVETTLFGENESIVLHLSQFALHPHGEGYSFILGQAESNRPWLNNLLRHVVGKALPVPHLPQLAPYMGLALELIGPLKGCD